MHRDIVNHSPDSPALLRGEGWGEGLYPQALKPLLDLYPLTRIASAMQSDLSPQAGRGKKSRGQLQRALQEFQPVLPPKISPDGST